MAMTWFKHEVGVRSNSKFDPLIVRHGMAGYGTYWALTEKMLQEEHKPEIDLSDDDMTAGIAYSIGMTADQLVSIIEDCCRWGLFNAEKWSEGRLLTSEYACSKNEEYAETCRRNAENIKKRWAKENDVIE